MADMRIADALVCYFVYASLITIKVVSTVTIGHHWCSMSTSFSGCLPYYIIMLSPVAFVRQLVRPSVAYIANNSRTQMPIVPKFGR